MADDPKDRLPPWLPYLGAAVAIGSMIFQGGVLSGKVESNASRITTLEARAAKADEALSTINVRGARIEAKLDFLVDPKSKD